jgi:endonuclease YncB( thermonuclease family)
MSIAGIFAVLVLTLAIDSTSWPLLAAWAERLVVGRPAVAPGQAYVIGIVDGDTIRVSIDGQIETVRLAHVDTPERGKRARCDRERDLAERASQRVAGLLNGKTVDLRAQGREKWGRLLATVAVDGVDISGLLIREGLGVPYEGRGARMDWCR